MKRKLLAGLALVLVVVSGALAAGEDLAAEEMRQHLQSLNGHGSRAGVVPNQVNHRSPTAQTDAWWGPRVQLTTDGTSQYTGYTEQNSLAIDTAGNLHVVWYNTRTTDYQVYYRKYWAQGDTWGAELQLTSLTAGDAYRPALACDNSGNVHVGWYSTSAGYYGIWYKKWDVGTQSWGTDTLLIPGASATYQYYPHIVCRPGYDNVHIVWRGEPMPGGGTYLAWHIEYVPGSGWGARTQVCTYASDICDDVSCAVTGSNDVHVVWTQDTLSGSTNHPVYYRARTGGSWGSIEQVSPTAMDVDFAYDPFVAVDAGGDVHVAWEQDPVGSSDVYDRIYYRKRASGSWGNVDTLSQNASSGNAWDPKIMSEGNDLHLVWRGDPPSGFPGSIDQIWYRKYNSGTSTWEPIEQATDFTSGIVYYPHVVVSSPYVHIAAYGNQSGNNDVWYTRGMPPSPTDVGVYSLVGPSGAYQIGDTVVPRAWVRNYGSASQSGFTVRMKIGAAYEQTVSAPGIAPGDSALLTFSPDWIASSGSYAVSCSTELSGDARPANNAVHAGVIVLSWIEDFDSGPGGFTEWNNSGAGWEHGVPTQSTGPASANSVPNCWGTDLDANHGADADWRLHSCKLEATQDSPTLSFWYWQDCFEPWDGWNIKYSTDSVNFTLIQGPGTHTPGYADVMASSNYCLAGESAYCANPTEPTAPWEMASFIIPVSAGQSFWVRWHFGSTSVVEYEGAFIDDVGGTGLRPWVPLDHDVGVSHLLTPSGLADSGATLVPTCSVVNAGLNPAASFTVRMKIGSFYNETATVTSLAPGTKEYVEFTTATLNQPLGTYAVSCSTEYLLDEDDINDRVTGTVELHVPDVEALEIHAPAGSYPGGAVVTPDGTWRNNDVHHSGPFEAWMLLDDAAGTRVYAEKVDHPGMAPNVPTRISSFPVCTLSTSGTWGVRCSTHRANDGNPGNDFLDGDFQVSGTDAGVVSIESPAGIVVGGTSVTPSATVRNFGAAPVWLRAWFVMNDPTDAEVYREYVELGSLGGGMDSTVTFPGHVVGTNGTWAVRCSVVAPGDTATDNDWLDGTFTVRPSLTSGWVEVAPQPGAVPVKRGGWLALHGDGMIYATKGNKTYEFYHVRPAWRIPGCGRPTCRWARSTRTRARRASVTARSYIYATKGKNTLEFYRYSVPADSWDVPAAGARGPAPQEGQGRHRLRVGGIRLGRRWSTC